MIEVLAFLVTICQLNIVLNGIFKHRNAKILENVFYINRKSRIEVRQNSIFIRITLYNGLKAEVGSALADRHDS